MCIHMYIGRCFIAHGVTIRADLAGVQIQKYTFIDEQTMLQPCHLHTKADDEDTLRYIPLSIGSHCTIGKRCSIEAAVLGMGCSVGDGCVLSKRCILKDFVRIESGTVIPPDMVCPPFSIIAGSPARIIGNLDMIIHKHLYVYV
jgi:dynactin-5